MSRYALPHPAQVEFRSKTYNHDESYEVHVHMAGARGYHDNIEWRIPTANYAKHWAAYERLCKAIEAHRAINND